MAGKKIATMKEDGTTVNAPKSVKITKIVVDLRRRVLLAYAGNVLAKTYDCVVGRPKHETTPGKYRIFRKEPIWYSKAYNNAPMPYSMFFDKDYKAIHGTTRATIRSFAGYLGLGRWIPSVGSHGCVGLTEDDANELYERTPNHTRVEVIKGE